jgi:hypothetical protein
MSRRLLKPELDYRIASHLDHWKVAALCCNPFAEVTFDRMVLAAQKSTETGSTNFWSVLGIARLPLLQKQRQSSNN